MSDRGLRTLAVVVISTVLVCVLLALPTFTQQQNPWFVIPYLVYVSVGAVICWYRPRNAVGWVFVMVALVGALSAGGNQLAHLAFIDDVPTGSRVPTAQDPLVVSVPWWGWLGGWLQAWTWYAILDLATVWTFLLFPSGLLSRFWRGVFAVNAFALAAVTLMGAFRPYVPIGSDADLLTLCGVDGKAHCLVGAPNLIAPGFMDRPDFVDVENSAAFNAFGALMLVTALLSVISVVVRFRRSRGVERLQMRWFVSATIAVVVLFSLQGLADRLPTSLGNLLMSVVVSLVPLACGAAILRYRLYDIDRIISRTASYAVVTTLVLAVYALAVTSASGLLPEGSSTFVVAAATLLAAALVRPLLSRVQSVVDRRFNRQKVDAQRAVDEYGAQLVDEVDLARAGDELLRVTQRVMSPSLVGLWTTGGPT